MSRFVLAGFLLFWIECVYPASLQAQSQIPRIHSVGIYLHQTPTAGGFEYSIETFHSAGADAYDLKLVAPDGTEFPSSNHEIHKATFQEIAEIAFGEWTAYESYGVTGANYGFTLLPFELESVSQTYPVISSPANHAKVPTEFDVSWRYSDGTEPNSLQMSIHHSPNYKLGPPQSAPGECCTALIDGEITGPGPVWAEIYANHRTMLPDPILTDGTSDSATDRFWLSAGYNARSELLSVTIVPEPPAFALSALIGMVVALSRWYGILRRTACPSCA